MFFPLGLMAIGEKAEIAESKACLPGPASLPDGCGTGNGQGPGHGHRHGCIGCGAHGSRGMAPVSRIEDMGIRAGKTVEMLNNEGGRSLLVRVDETRIALSRAVAMKIMVRRKVDEPGRP